MKVKAVIVIMAILLTPGLVQAEDFIPAPIPPVCEPTTLPNGLVIAPRAERMPEFVSGSLCNP